MAKGEPKTRTVAIEDELWRRLEKLSHFMAIDPEALVSQAVFTFARVNGYLDPLEFEHSRAVMPIPEVDLATSPPAKVKSETERKPKPAAAGQESGSPQERLAAIEAEMDAIFSKSGAEPAKGGETARGAEATPEEPASEPDAPAAEENAAEAGDGEDLESEAEAAPAPGEEPPTRPPPSRPSAPQRPVVSTQIRAQDQRRPTSAKIPATRQKGSLHLEFDGIEPRQVTGERFILGRGKECNVALESNRVSREHAAIVKDGDGWAIEDLGSSNGTWFAGARIKRRRIVDQDEYLVGNVKIRCVFR